MFSTFDEAYAYLTVQEKIPKYNIENITEAVELLGHPERSFQSIHITGTNGKGSVVRMCYQILREAGYSVGVFLSPHLLDLRERFVVDDEWIDNKNFVEILSKIASLPIELSRFEKYVLLAFLYFQKKKVDYAVIEVGVGALNDATNVLLPEVSVITNIGLDHPKTLGDTLDQVAFHKSAIIKPNTPVVLGVYHPKFEEVAKQMNAPIIYPFEEKQTNLIGKHQKTNASIAYEVGKVLGIDEAIISGALLKVRHKGRLEYITKNLLIDGAHNEDGLKNLLSYIQTIEHNFEKIFYCFSLKKNKDAKLIIDIFGKEKKYIIVGFESEMLEPETNLQNQALQIGVECEIFEVDTIILRAKKEPHNLYVVFGSLYMIGQFLRD